MNDTNYYQYILSIPPPNYLMWWHGHQMSGILSVQAIFKLQTAKHFCGEKNKYNPYFPFLINLQEQAQVKLSSQLT